MLMEGAITVTLDFVPAGRLQKGDARQGSEFAREFETMLLTGHPPAVTPPTVPIVSLAANRERCQLDRI
jgi:hypothetical protein